MEKRLIVSMLSGFMILFGCFLHAEGAARISSETEATVQPQKRPSVIWVSDFELDSTDVKEGGGILGGEGPLRRGGLRGGGILRRHESPEAQARKIVDLLSTRLTQELKNRSLPAKRLLAGQPLPDKGWLIRGQFLEVDEGNRLRRAVIGFGAGATDMQIEAMVVNLETYPDRPFLLMTSDAESGKLPGAVVTMNPYVAAVKFVLSKNASKRDVRSTARRIAAEITNYMKAHGLMSSQ